MIVIICWLNVFKAMHRKKKNNRWMNTVQMCCILWVSECINCEVWAEISVSSNVFCEAQWLCSETWAGRFWQVCVCVFECLGPGARAVLHLWGTERRVDHIRSHQTRSEVMRRFFRVDRDEDYGQIQYLTAKCIRLSQEKGKRANHRLIFRSSQTGEEDGHCCRSNSENAENKHIFLSVSECWGIQSCHLFDSWYDHIK